MPSSYKNLSAVHRKFWPFYFLPVFIVLIPVIISCGCNTGKNAYRNVYEKNYMKRSRSSIMIWHDKKAIKHKTKDGVYTVIFYYNSGWGGICKSDTNTIMVRAISTAKYVRKFMNHKENYRYIDVVYNCNNTSNDSIPDRNSPRAEEIISCYYQIRMPLDSITNVKIMYSHNDFRPEFQKRVRF